MKVDFSSLPSEMHNHLVKHGSPKGNEIAGKNQVRTEIYRSKMSEQPDKKQKRKNSFEGAVTLKSKKVNIEKKGYYMPTGLIPILSDRELSKALKNRWGLTVSTGWLVVEDIGDPQQYDNNSFLNIVVHNDKISNHEETKLRINVGLPIPNAFPVDALRIGNRIRSKKCKLFNKGKGFATISIIDAIFVVDTAHENYQPFQPMIENEEF